MGSKTFEIGVQRARFGLSELRSNTDRERGWEYAFRATRLIPTAGSITGVSRYGGQIPLGEHINISDLVLSRICE